MIYLPESTHAQHLACPECGKHTIVRHGEDDYVCLHCHWSRSLKSTEKEDNSFMPWTILMVTGIMVLILI